MAFITTTHQGYKTWFDDFFRLMGIAKERIIYVDKPIQCRSVIVPEQSMYLDSGESFTKEWRVPFEAIKTNVTPSKYKKLYLSRKDYEGVKRSFASVTCYNEKYFEDFFVSRGFKSISTEKMSIEEQLSLVLGADEIATTSGTLAHFALFCRPETKFIILSRRDVYYGWQPLVNEITKIDAYVIDCSKNFLPADTNVGFVLFAATKCWKDFVMDYFNEQIEEDDDYLHFDEELRIYLVDWFKRYVANEDLCINSIRTLCNRIIKLEKEVYKKRPILTYQTHVDKDGWSDWKIENHLSNSTEKDFDIQAVKIDFSNPLCKLYYSVYYNEQEGWSEEVTNNQMAGTTGKSKPIYGIKIRLDEIGEKKYDIIYRVHKFDGTWSDWAQNGAGIISDQRLNSLQIKLNSKRIFTIEKSESGQFVIADK